MARLLGWPDLGGFGSGGSNRRPPGDHVIRGTFRRDRHAVAGLPIDVRKDAREIYERLLALGNRYFAQAGTAKGAKRAPRALGVALRCWSEALKIARLLGSAPEPPKQNRLDEHLARRRKVVQIRDRPRDPAHDVPSSSEGA